MEKRRRIEGRRREASTLVPPRYILSPPISAATKVRRGRRRGGIEFDTPAQHTGLESGPGRQKWGKVSAGQILSYVKVRPKGYAREGGRGTREDCALFSIGGEGTEAKGGRAKKAGRQASKLAWPSETTDDGPSPFLPPPPLSFSKARGRRARKGAGRRKHVYYLLIHVRTTHARERYVFFSHGKKG